MDSQMGDHLVYLRVGMTDALMDHLKGSPIQRAVMMAVMMVQ